MKKTTQPGPPPCHIRFLSYQEKINTTKYLINQSQWYSIFFFFYLLLKMLEIYGCNFFTCIGYLVCGVFCLKLFVRLLRFYVGHFTKPAVDFKTLGKYAVVTGATDGIGKVFFLRISFFNYFFLNNGRRMPLSWQGMA